MLEIGFDSSLFILVERFAAILRKSDEAQTSKIEIARQIDKHMHLDFILVNACLVTVEPKC